ncbi:JAB domain-containing protein [Sphingomonas sp.]|uniref:JAB domain-containing protein n=1 Tax=Sphingomonas sp. TaxID=28214 RepID=UPI002EDA73E5
MALQASLPSPGTPFEAIGRLVADSVAGERVEVAAFAYCDDAGRMLGIRHARSDAADAVDLPVRRVAIDALSLDAAVVVMAHNHPRGEAWPSQADREATRRLADALRTLGVRLHEHLVVGAGEAWSFRAAGLL